MGSIANLLAAQIDFSPPNYKEGRFGVFADTCQLQGLGISDKWKCFPGV